MFENRQKFPFNVLLLPQVSPVEPMTEVRYMLRDARSRKKEINIATEGLGRTLPTMNQRSTPVISYPSIHSRLP